MAENAAGSGIPGDTELRQLMNEEINKAFTGWAKRELPKLMQTQMQTVVAGMQDQLAETFLERLSQELPSDEEIDAMEAQEFEREAEAHGMSPEEFAEALEAQAGGEEKQMIQRQQQPAVDPRLNGQVLELRRANERLQREMEEFKQLREEAERKAEEADRYSAINGHISHFPWKDDKGREIAFDYLKNRSKRAEDGGIVIDDLPAKQWIEDNSDMFAGFFQPKTAQGAGAFNAGFGVKGKGPDTDQIKPGMSAEDKKNIASAALAALGAQVPNL